MNKTPPPSDGDGIAARVRTELAEIEAEVGPGASFMPYQGEAMAFLRLLGPRRQHWLPSQLTPRMFSRICQRRLAELDPNTASPRQACRDLRFVLKRLVEFGLPPECVSAACSPIRRFGRKKL